MSRCMKNMAKRVVSIRLFWFYFVSFSYSGVQWRLLKVNTKLSAKLHKKIACKRVLQKSPSTLQWKVHFKLNTEMCESACERNKMPLLQQMKKCQSNVYHQLHKRVGEVLFKNTPKNCNIAQKIGLQFYCIFEHFWQFLHTFFC